MTFFRATHVVELAEGNRSVQVALRLVSDPCEGVQVYRDAFANEFIVDPSFGCSVWPTHTAIHALQSDAVPLSWLRSAKPSTGLCFGARLFACA
jgi:hypothetical protein